MTSMLVVSCVMERMRHTYSYHVRNSVSHIAIDLCNDYSIYTYFSGSHM